MWRDLHVHRATGAHYWPILACGTRVRVTTRSSETLSETWLNSSTTNAEVKIQEYNIYRFDRKHKKGGGVCIYVRNDFKTKVLKNLSYISPVGFHQLWLQIQVNKNKSMIVCVTYRPPDCPVTPLQKFHIKVHI